MKQVLFMAGCLLLAVQLQAASSGETQAFLRQHRHAWLPYPFPAETSTNELARLLDFPFDIIGLSFAGSYHGGDIDFSTLDTAVAMVAARGRTAVLSLTPRFDASDGVFDRLTDGSVITNVPYKNPNASMIDVFDPAQREKFCRWIDLCVGRYGKDPRVSGFVIGWGYMGETGFFIGDYLSDFDKLDSVASGYSTNALAEFNRWRQKHGLSNLLQLPLPSVAGPDRDYILFQRFRTEFAGGVFQKEAVARAQALTRKPVGIFGYISVNAANYARNWAPTPNADFYRSAVSAASFDMGRTLLDSGMGYEDSELSDVPWNYTVAAIERNIARQMAHGGVFHAMPVRDFVKCPPWETNYFPRLADFLLTQRLAEKVRVSPVDVALFQPTWSAAALPIRDAAHPFAPRAAAQERCAKTIGLVESFGVPYQLITERELLAPRALKKYRRIIIPLWDLMPEILDRKSYGQLARDPRVIPILSGDRSMTRSEFRELLRQYNVPIRLDFDSDKILAGRVNNLIFNWSDRPLTVQIPVENQPLLLQPMEYRFVTNAP